MVKMRTVCKLFFLWLHVEEWKLALLNSSVQLPQPCKQWLHNLESLILEIARIRD